MSGIILRRFVYQTVQTLNKSNPRSISTLSGTASRCLRPSHVFSCAPQSARSSSSFPLALSPSFDRSLLSAAPSWRLSPRFFASSAPEHVLLSMPALSPTMEKGNLVAWKKKVGDKVSAGDVLCVIETDKATIDWECTEDGYVAALLINDGTNDLPVGTAAAVLVPSQSSLSFFENYKHDSAALAPAASTPAASTPAAPAAAPAAPAASSYPPHLEVGMPALSPTMEKGNVTQWKKAVGDAVKPGDLLCIIETDKASIDFEATEEGFLAAILAPNGTSDVPVGKLIAVIAENAADVAAFADFQASSSSSTSTSAPSTTSTSTPSSSSSSSTSSPSSTPSASSNGGRVFASPRARALANEKQFDIQQIPGTGPNGRVIQADVLSFQPAAAPVVAAAKSAESSKPSAPAPSSAAASTLAAFTDIPHSNIRKVIAERLTFSKQNIPHYYLTMEVNVDELLKTRAQMNEAAKGAYKLSVNDFVVKAAAVALRQMPEVNAQWTDTAIRRFHTVDINVAVATENGLLTPLIRNADNIGLTAISSRVRELADAAKAKKIAPSDLAPGTFTISNLGMFGITSFAAVINPPQACILAVGGTEKRVVVDEHDEAQFKVVSTMTVTLSCDHRVVDGAVGATWLQKFKALIERPVNMLLY